MVDASAITFSDIAGLRAISALAQSGRTVLVLTPNACCLHLLRLLALMGCGPGVQALRPRNQAVVLLPSLLDV